MKPGSREHLVFITTEIRGTAHIPGPNPKNPELVEKLCDLALDTYDKGDRDSVGLIMVLATSLAQGLNRELRETLLEFSISRIEIDCAVPAEQPPEGGFAA